MITGIDDDDGPWVVTFGYCVACGRLFGFNPHRVPSLRVRGEREPVCRACIERANTIRVERGLAPLDILPGAYDPIHDRDL